MVFPGPHYTIKLKSMALNSFYINILIRILLLSGTNLIFFYFLVHYNRFFTILLLGILIIVQVIWLIYYVNGVNRSLARFLLTLGEEETMLVPIQNKIEKTFRGLQYSFNRLNKEIGRMRLEKQYTSVLIQKIIDHLGNGILAWNNEGKVELANEAGLRLLGLNQLEAINQMDEKYPGVITKLEGIKSGEKAMLNLTIEGTSMPFLFRANEFPLGENHITLVAFQNIRAELEENEMISWEKLIRVLTHEVSNSVTPITTLGSNIKKRLQSVVMESKPVYSIGESLAIDIKRSAELIEQRGNRLIDFIQQYKSMMMLPDPDLKPVRIKEIVSDVCSLCKDLDSPVKYTIHYNVHPPNIVCLIDRKLIEQVLINLVRNAVEALSADKDGIINVEVKMEDKDEIIIRIQDNGTGIPPDILDQVFIPFFTTRDKGSGIGLSLSRRIIQLHGGTVNIRSEEGIGSIVCITLPYTISK